MSGYSSDAAFTPSVKAVQARKGSRRAYGRMEERGAWQTRITPDLARFIAAQTSISLATANAEGQPYIQHRGGPPGFLRVLDEKTIGFADFVGNFACAHKGSLETSTAMNRVITLEYTGDSGAKGPLNRRGQDRQSSWPQEGCRGVSAR